jgi:arylsulfatase A-like enzyme
MALSRCRARLVLSALAACAALACHGPAASAPPIVLITLEGLRPDSLGALGGPATLAPALDRFAAEADWVGVAVASAGSPGPALVSLLTGLPAHQHGSWSEGRPRLHAELESLAAALRAASYRTAAYRQGDLLRRQQSLAEGFDIYEPANPRPRVLAALRTLRPARDFLWLHSSLPGGEPLVLRERFRDRLPDAPAELPRRLRSSEAAAGPEGAAVRRALYLSNVAQADLELGELLAELRDHGPWERALVAIVGVTGWSPDSSRGRGGGLERAQLEVPLLVKLPRIFARRLAPGADERVGAGRLVATLLEAAGGDPVPAAAPSLFRPQRPGALSESFGGNGVNEFSLVQGDLRLLRRVHFAAPEPEYAAARDRSVRRGPGGPREPARRILRRLHRAFLRTPPYSGGPHELYCERWLPGGAVEPVADPEAIAALSAALDRNYFAFLDEEHAPARDESPGE